jgi:hypothetical protein
MQHEYDVDGAHDTGPVICDGFKVNELGKIHGEGSIRADSDSVPVLWSDARDQSLVVA